MRQFVFGLVAAALLFWLYSVWSGRSAAAGAGAAGEGNGLDRLIASGTFEKPPAPANEPARTEAAPKPLEAVPAGEEAVVCEKARTALQQGDAAETARVWEVLALNQVPATLRQRLGKVTAEVGAGLKPEEAERAVAMLGSGNAFLHSAEGRQAGKHALELCTQQKDEVAIKLTTRLLEACMRGPIAKTDCEEHAFVDEAYAEHKKIAERWLCDPANLTHARSYQVKRGDSLVSIAKRFQGEDVLVDDGTLALLNRIHNPNALQANQQIKVPVDPIRTVVEKRSFLMAVYVGDAILRLYWVAHGVNDKTPVTVFTVEEKLKDPPWYSPEGVIPFGHPKNILGKYFVKFRHESYQGYGAHGTPMPETIGTMASDGCIRMYAADIEEYFKIVPRRSKVEIRAG